jgi:hypothetical protein
VTQPASPFVPHTSMEEHIAMGMARPLLDVPMGPVRFAGGWWVVPKTEPDRYLPVDDPHVISVLDGAERRIAAGGAEA